MSRTAHAEELAEDGRLIGQDAARLNAAAWAAGVAPEATHGIVGAALGLGAPQTALFARSKPLEHDKAMLEAAGDLEGSCAEMLRDARRQGDSAASEAEAAARAIEAAQRAMRRAKTKDESAGLARAIEGAQRRIADCETAMEILGDVAKRLHYAVTCLSRVPDDLAATYEKPYDVIRAGGVLPFAGDFLTGGNLLTTGRPA